MRPAPLLAALALAAPASAGDKPSAAAVVDRQLAAYNAHDLDAFMATYSPDVELYEFPDKLLAKGAAAVRERYKTRFADAILKAEIVNRMVIGERVIDREHIVRTWPEGPGTWDAVVIYEVKDGLIAKAFFILGEKTVDKK